MEAAARRMVERVQKLGARAESLGSDKAYGSSEFMAWLLERGVQPRIPVIDRRHQADGHFTHDRYAPTEDVCNCPQGCLALSRSEPCVSGVRLQRNRGAVQKVPDST